MTGTLGAYRLDAELGAGGMGKVWRAEVVGRTPGLPIGRVVAVKIVHPHLMETRGFFKRFLREAEIGKAVVHENVVRTFDADAVVASGVQHHFLVMEYVEGQTLRGLLEELGRVPEELCRHIGREIAKGLAAIHAAGVVHRDLKPENVIISRCTAPGHDRGTERPPTRRREGEVLLPHRCNHAVKVMDLGVARLAEESLRLSQTGAFVGSVHYAAPEQFGFRDGLSAPEPNPLRPAGAARGAKGGDIDGRADLFSLGVVLYELATARHPFHASDFRNMMRRVLHEKPARLSDVSPQLSAFFDEVVHTLLSRRREDRFASAADLAQVLEEGERSEWWKSRAKSITVTTMRPTRRLRAPRETAVYGREAELALLRSHYGRAKDGEGCVALVVGEAGIGKSRLVDEFVEELERDGEELHFLCGSYPPGGAATASGAFSTAYRERFGEAGAAAYLRETPILVPAFDALLRGEGTPPGVEPLTKDSLHTCFVHVTRNLAAEKPTIVLIDDLHFAPEEGRALFAALALAVPGHRVLLVGTTRPGIEGKWLSELDRVGASRIAVPRLRPEHLARLLADTLKSEATANALADQVATKSDGNPFFVLEILRGLREGRFIRKEDDGSWIAARVIEHIDVPASVLDLVNARVADLDADDRDLLDAASCCGFEFDPQLVAAALGMAPVPALQRLARVERKHRLVRSAGRRFVFDHHQVQEALYGGLHEQMREAYHAAIANAMEAGSGAASKPPEALDGTLSVDLAEHFLKGAQGARALRYLGAALTHLEAGWLNGATVRLADRALGVEGLVAGTARVELLLRKAERLDLLGRTDDERAALDDAVARADAEGGGALRGRAHAELGWHLYRIGAFAEAEAVTSAALEFAQAAGDRKTEARASAILGHVCWNAGRYPEAREHHERCLAIDRSTGDRRGEARALGNLGLVYGSLGLFAVAKVHYQRHLALARKAGDRRGESIATGNLGVVFHNLGSYAEARELYERNLVLARETGYRRGETAATGNLGAINLSLGRYAEARRIFGRYVELAREMGNRDSEALALCNVGSVNLALGRTAEAREALLASLAVSREIGARAGEGYALVMLGQVADEEGGSTEAARHFDESLALRRAIGHADGIADTLLEIGDLRRRAVDAAGARAALDEALALARERELRQQTALAAALLASVPGAEGAAAAGLVAPDDGEHVHRIRLHLWHATRRREHLVEAKRRLDFLVEHAPPECRESMLANVRVNREIVAAAREQGV